MESRSPYQPTVTGTLGNETAILPLIQHVAAARKLSTRDARLARVLADHRLQALLMMTLDAERLQVAPPSHFEAARCGLLELRCPQGAVQVAVDLANWPALGSVARYDGDGDPAQTELRLAVASSLLEPLTNALGTLGLGDVRVSALRTVKLRPEVSVHPISLQRAGRDIEFGLVEVADGWLEALEQAIDMQCIPFPPGVSGLAVPGRIEFGARTLNIATLESLRPGDVVVRGIPYSAPSLFGENPEPISVSITWGSHGMRQLRCTANIDATTLTLTGVPYMSLDTHDDNLSAAAPHDVPVPIGELDLPIKIEIDTVSLPVAKLSALRAGYVLELPVLVRDAQVRLVSYGQTIAHGELVAVGEHVGVRILRMCNQSVPV